MYDSDNNKDYYYKDECAPKGKKENPCVEINIFCDDCKKEPKEAPNKDEKKKDREDKTCVEINIFCSHCKKEPKDDPYKGDCK